MDEGRRKEVKRLSFLQRFEGKKQLISKNGLIQSLSRGPVSLRRKNIVTENSLSQSNLKQNLNQKIVAAKFNRMMTESSNMKPIMRKSSHRSENVFSKLNPEQQQSKKKKQLLPIVIKKSHSHKLFLKRDEGQAELRQKSELDPFAYSHLQKLERLEELLRNRRKKLSKNNKT